MQTHRHILCADDIAFGNGNMFLAVAVIFKSHDMKIAKARGQFSHRHHAHTNFVPAKAIAVMLGILFQNHFKLFVHRCCHSYLLSLRLSLRLLQDGL